MKTAIITIQLVLLFCLSFPSFGQNFDQAVVKVFTNQKMKSGSGIICGFRASKLYIATAYHVIEGSTDAIKVQLNIPGFVDLLPARVHEELSQELDLAVLIVPLSPMLYIEYESYFYKQADLDRVKEKSGVITIGYPDNKMDVNTFNEVKNIIFNADEISITATGIATGFSGGAVLSQKKDRLLGMVLKISPGGSSVPVLKISTILKYFELWNIPRNLVKPFKIPLNPLAVALSGVAIGKTAWGLDLNNTIKDLKAIEKIYRTDEKLQEAEGANGMNHEELQQDVNKKVDQRNLIYVLAGGCLAAAVTVHILHNKRGNKRRKASTGPSNTDLFFNRVSLFQSGTSVGIRVRL